MERDYQKDFEVCEKATEGPWDIRGHWGSVHGKVIYSGVGEENRTIVNFPYGNVVGLPEGWKEKDKVYQQLLANVGFIAIARTALPWYIKRCMEMEDQLTRQISKTIESNNKLQQAEEREAALREALEEIAESSICKASRNIARQALSSPSQPSRYREALAVVEAAKKHIGSGGYVLPELLNALTAYDKSGEANGGER